MTLPMYCQPPAVPRPVMHRPAVPRLPAPVYWFRRVLAAGVLLLVFWASSLLAGELRWVLTPEDPVADLPHSAPAYVIVGDTALRVGADGGRSTSAASSERAGEWAR